MRVLFDRGTDRAGVMHRRCRILRTNRFPSGGHPRVALPFPRKGAGGIGSIIANYPTDQSKRSAARREKAGREAGGRESESGRPRRSANGLRPKGSRERAPEGSDRRANGTRPTTPASAAHSARHAQSTKRGRKKNIRAGR